MFPGFPAYSPDLNIIEKVWRELQLRVLACANKINSKATHRKVIEEEWEKLEAERTENTVHGGMWIGYNNLAMKFEDICGEVWKVGGWDTKYM